jgi:hypothetical protein
MKLTIIPLDGAVYENDVSYLSLTWNGTPINVHALQWQDVKGWVEYNDGKLNEDITVLPDWAYNAMDAWQVAYDEAHKPPPPPTAEENKQTAIKYLQNTDWTQISSVSDPALSNPYLSNKLAFDQYRNTIRQIALYPVAGNIDWAIMPEEVWVQV